MPASRSPSDPAWLFDDTVGDAARAPLAEVLSHLPGVAAIAFDTELRLQLAEGSAMAAAGYTTATVRGRRLGDVIPADACAVLEPHYAAVLRGEHRTFEYDTVVDAGVFGVVAGPVRGEGGRIVGGLALMVEITDRVIGTRRLAEAEAHYRLLAETSTDIISLHDLAGTYVWISPSVRSALGYAPAEVVGRTPFDFVHADEADEVAGLLGALAAGTDTGVATFRARHADGSYVWIESLARAIRDPADGEVREIRVASRDVTARKALEQAERDAHEELRRRLAQTAALARLGEQAIEERDPFRLAEAAVRAVAETLEVPMSTIVELDGATGVLRASVGVEAGLLGTTVLELGDRERALDLVADGPVVLDDPAREAGVTARGLRGKGLRATAAVLVGDRESPWGLLTAHTCEPRGFDVHDQDFLRSMAHVVADALERHRAEEAARYEQLHDRLTGLPNRALLVDRLTHALARRTEAPASRIAVLVLNLDEFKLVNDSLGHEAGDELLGQVGPRLREVLRPQDTVARVSGDSFAVLCEEVRDEADALLVAERILAAFTRPFVIARGVQHFVAATVGVVVSAGGHGADDLLRDADAAMYRAKDAGRGRYELFDPIMRQRAVTRLRIEGELRRALDQGELLLHYQPIRALPGHRLAGVEALVRWDHPERRLVPPGEFIPVAEASGLVVPVGTWVLREACRQLAAWQRDHPSSASMRLTINLSARQVARQELVMIVREAIESNGLDPARIGLEITEGLLMQDSPIVAATLRGLKDLGVRLILDDFGTGYSSLSYLKRFPIDQIKIDRSFVSGIAEPGDDRAIVEAIVGMADALGLDVIPEGVETAEQLAVLEDLRCGFAQGFLLGRPMPPGELAALLPAG